MRTILIFSLIVALLGGCAGTGLKDSSQILAQIDSRKNSKSVFVLRDTGFQGSGSTVDVRLNGLSIGAIGVDEVAIGTAEDGTNTLWADFTLWGLRGPAEASFTSNSTENHYFIMTQEVKAFSTERKLLEVSESTFKNSL